MPQPSFFAAEWRACLAEQYQQVVRGSNRAQRDDYAQTLRDAGFSESEIAQLYLDATLRQEDLPAGFVPDLALLEETRAALGPHPDECACPRCQP